MIPHGGNREEASRRFGIPAEAFLDFSASVSPLGMPESVRAAVLGAMGTLDRYPDPDCGVLRTALARRHGRKEEEILVTNGATEALSLALRACRPRRTGALAPCYRDLERVSEQAGAVLDFHRLEETRGFAPDWEALPGWIPGHDIVAIGTPNNPTGVLAPKEEILGMAGRFPDTLFLVDEAFLDFAEAPSLADGAPGNVLVLRSLTKFYAIPGLRLGYAVGAAERIAAMRACGEPWSVNSLAQAAGLAALADEAYAKRLRAWVADSRETLSAGLRRLGFTVYPSQANFLLARLPRGGRASALAERLGRRGILVRDASDFPGLGPDFIRLAVRLPDENARLLAEMGKAGHAAS